MQAKQEKEKLEKTVKQALERFEKHTGLQVGWIDIQKNRPAGFNNQAEELKCSVKIKDAL